MQIPETPSTITELDLMKRLAAYADGSASYLKDGNSSEEGISLGIRVKQSCHQLHAMLCQLNETVAPLLDRVTAKEMDVFTAHDEQHALKVAHLMWLITAPDRRELLTPPEIGLLVASAFLHDLGMFLSNPAREARLSADSDLWDRLEINQDVRRRIEDLTTAANSESVPAKQQRLMRQLIEAQEALLCIDTRERHATAERYEQIVAEIRTLHQRDPSKIADIDQTASFEGDSFLDKLIDICVSHNEPAKALVQRDRISNERTRFANDYPIGSVTADLHFVAAALRMADVLDFDRERTPAVLYYYLLPSTLDPAEDRSVLEWSKHLSISNWNIDANEIVFRGRCKNHIVHHGVVHFCEVISAEIAATRATFGGGSRSAWPFALPAVVRADLHAEGYTYVPYRFELDEERVYQLLLGGAIYENPLFAIRELIQNAVDACRLRDALTRTDDPAVSPSSENRIFVDYYEPTAGEPHPILEIHDTGTGMDEWVLTHWFLKVGRSFYASSEFDQFRVRLREHGEDFAPVSEFGIGFLACFLLADRVEVETAMWEALRGDTRKRLLEIHGPTRLIRLVDSENTGTTRFRGTRVRLTLARGNLFDRSRPPSWDAVESFITRTCLALPYRLHLRHHSGDSVVDTYVDPQSLKLSLPAELEPYSVTIPVGNNDAGLEGEILIVHPQKAAAFDRNLATSSAVRLIAEHLGYAEELHGETESTLIRGGFRIGPVPGLPWTFQSGRAVQARLKMDWKNRRERRYPQTNLARTRLTDDTEIQNQVIRLWVGWLLEHVDKLPEGLLNDLDFPRKAWGHPPGLWLERFDAYTLYRLAANGWHARLKEWDVTAEEISGWETSRGAPLRRPAMHQCYQWLQDLVLPKVSGLQMAPEAKFYFTPPVPGWVEILKNWKSFVRERVQWGMFVQYIEDISDVLYYEYPGSDFLNSRFRERVSTGFAQNEIPQLIEAFRRLAHQKQQRQIKLSASTVELLRRAQDKLGDLQISELFQRWRLDAFNLPKI